MPESVSFSEASLISQLFLLENLSTSQQSIDVSVGNRLARSAVNRKVGVQAHPGTIVLALPEGSFFVISILSVMLLVLLPL